jgi:hypothetical protein
LIFFFFFFFCSRGFDGAEFFLKPTNGEAQCIGTAHEGRRSAQGPAQGSTSIAALQKKKKKKKSADYFFFSFVKVKASLLSLRLAKVTNGAAAKLGEIKQVG